MLVVNKIDNVGMESEIYDFYQLGLGDPIGISSVNMLNFGDLLEELCKHFPEPDEEEDPTAPVQIAVVGRPNVGKSSLVNRMLGEERVMVSDIAGTTRDAIDTRFTDETGEEYILIDTAGIRKRKSIEYQSLERYSIVRVAGRHRPMRRGAAAHRRAAGRDRAGQQNRRLYRRAGQGRRHHRQ